MIAENNSVEVIPVCESNENDIFIRWKSEDLIDEEFGVFFISL